MRARPCWLLLATLGAGCGSTTPGVPLGEVIDGIVATAVSEDSLSGAIVLSRNGEVVYQRGVGMANAGAGVAFTAATPADGGSLAKPFTAAALWTLVVAGRIDLDAAVTRYVPEYPHADTRVRHLISHSNGLPPYYEYFDPFFGRDEVRTTQALLRVVAREQPAPSFEPGTRFEYSNLGFDAAALVLERVTGLGYEALLRQQFFGPLGMTATFARPARFADWQGIRTLGYRWIEGRREVRDVYDMEAFLGASNLYFSALDLARWANAHAMGTALPDSVERAGRERPLIDGRPSAISGLSWYCDAAGTRCHYGGDNNAFHSLVYWDRSRRESVILVTNSSVPPWKAVTLQRQLVAALAGEPVRADPPVSFSVFASDTAVAEGTYAAPGGGTVTVRRGGDGLTAQVDCGLTTALFQVSEGTFYLPASDEFIAFSDGTRRLHLRSMFRDVVLTRAGEAASTGCR